LLIRNNKYDIGPSSHNRIIVINKGNGNICRFAHIFLQNS